MFSRTLGGERKKKNLQTPTYFKTNCSSPLILGLFLLDLRAVLLHNMMSVREKPVRYSWWKTSWVTHYYMRSHHSKNLRNPTLLAEEALCHSDKWQPYMGLSTEKKDLPTLAVAQLQHLTPTSAEYKYRIVPNGHWLLAAWRPWVEFNYRKNRF